MTLVKRRLTCTQSILDYVVRWVHQRVVIKALITETFERMAAVIDKQNTGDKLYKRWQGTLAPAWLTRRKNAQALLF